MKKDIFKIIIFVFLLLGVANTYNVHAEELPLSSLPKTYKTSETDGYEFTIKGFELRIYEVNTTNDEEAVKKFYRDNPDSVIPVSGNDLSIDPKFDVKNINGVPTTIVDLNLNLTKTKIESLLSEQKGQTTSNKAFLFELVLKYELKTPKVNTTYKYNFNAVKYVMTILAQENYNAENISLNSDVYQTLNIGSLSYDNASGSIQTTYETSWNEENKGLASYVINYLMLTNNEFSDTERTANDMLLFHNVDDINYIINQFGDASEPEIDPNKNPIKDIIDANKTQTVAVPNTAATIPNLVYIISALMIILGVGVITYTVVKE